jgi:hypothetical protein
MENNNLVLATMLDPFHKNCCFDFEYHGKCKDLLIKEVESTIQIEEGNIFPDLDVGDDLELENAEESALERFYRIQSGNDEVARPEQVFSPPILDEKIRATAVYYFKK